GRDLEQIALLRFQVTPVAGRNTMDDTEQRFSLGDPDRLGGRQSLNLFLRIRQDCLARIAHGPVCRFAVNVGEPRGNRTDRGREVFDAVAIEVTDYETWPERTVGNDRAPEDASQRSPCILHRRSGQWSGSAPLLRGRFGYGVR